MAREVTHDEEGLYIINEEELEEQGGTVAVCQCGLSGIDLLLRLKAGGIPTAPQALGY